MRPRWCAVALVGYSLAMSTVTAPDLTPGYPSKGPKLGPAWTALYTALHSAALTSEPFMDGQKLAASIASDYGLADATLVALLSRAAKAGILDREGRQVMTNRGVRTRTHYRVNVNV